MDISLFDKDSYHSWITLLNNGSDFALAPGYEVAANDLGDNSGVRCDNGSDDDSRNRRNMIIEDFTSDGLPDILRTTAYASGACHIHNRPRDVSLKRNNGNDGFDDSWEQWTSLTDFPEIGNTWPMTVGDFNGDGLLDLISASTETWFFADHGSVRQFLRSIYRSNNTP